MVKLFEFDTTTQKLEIPAKGQPVSKIDYQALREKAEKATVVSGRSNMDRADLMVMMR